MVPEVPYKGKSFDESIDSNELDEELSEGSIDEKTDRYQFDKNDKNHHQMILDNGGSAEIAFRTLIALN